MNSYLALLVSPSPSPSVSSKKQPRLNTRQRENSQDTPNVLVHIPIVFEPHASSGSSADFDNLAVTTNDDGVSVSINKIPVLLVTRGCFIVLVRKSEYRRAVLGSIPSPRTLPLPRVLRRLGFRNNLEEGGGHQMVQVCRCVSEQPTMAAVGRLVGQDS